MGVDGALKSCKCMLRSWSCGFGNPDSWSIRLFSITI